MSNLTKIPLQDGFKSFLSQSWDGNVGTVFLTSTPTFTFPVGVTTYAVVQPNGANAKLVEFDSYNAVNGTINVTNVTLLKGAGVNNPTGVTYPANTEVIISDNYQFWADIQTAINSKIDDDGTGIADGFDLATPTSGVRMRDDAGNLKFTDNFNAEVSLSTLAAASGADTKVAISTGDTTPSQLENKLTAGDGISFTKVNPLGNESLDVDIDLTDATVFTTTQGNADKVLKTDGSGNIDVSFQATEGVAGIVPKSSDAEASAGVEDTKYVTAKQVKDNSARTNVVLDSQAGVSNTKVIAHSLGVVPKSIIVNSVTDNGYLSFGAFDGTNNSCSYISGSSFADNDSAKCLANLNALGEGLYATITAVTSTNFTVQYVWVPGSSARNTYTTFTLIS